MGYRKELAIHNERHKEMEMCDEEGLESWCGAAPPGIGRGLWGQGKDRGYIGQVPGLWLLA